MIQLASLVSSLIGTGKAGYADGNFSDAQFNEPGDLEFSMDCKLLYVADTNNHKIRIIDMEKKIVSTVIIRKYILCSKILPYIAEFKINFIFLFGISSTEYKIKFGIIRRLIDFVLMNLIYLQLIVSICATRCKHH